MKLLEKNEEIIESKKKSELNMIEKVKSVVSSDNFKLEKETLLSQLDTLSTFENEYDYYWIKLSKLIYNVQ